MPRRSVSKVRLASGTADPIRQTSGRVFCQPEPAFWFRLTEDRRFCGAAVQGKREGCPRDFLHPDLTGFSLSRAVLLGLSPLCDLAQLLPDLKQEAVTGPIY